MNLDEPSSWIIDFTSVGPLVVGAEISSTDQVMVAFTREVFEGCESVISFTANALPSFAIPDRLGTGTIEQIVMQGGAAPADFSATSPRTIDGIGIGSTEDELTAAYPEITFQDDHNTPHYALADADGNWINFSVREGIVNDIVVRASPVVSKEYCS